MARTSEIDILSSFDTDQPQSAAQIVRKTAIPRSTVFRALRALTEVGFLRRPGGTGGYTLGPGILQLGLIARKQLSPEEFLSPPLLTLASRTSETVTFSLVDVPWRLCVIVLDAPSDLRSVAQAGSRYPLHVGAASNTILAHLPVEVATETLRFHGVQDGEIPARLARLDEIRAAGIATSMGQRVPGAMSVAAPVFSAGHLLGSVAVAGPGDRIASRVDEFRAAVIETGAALSERLSAERPTR